jgi:AcrR family transcriptional regulator
VAGPITYRSPRLRSVGSKGEERQMAAKAKQSRDNEAGGPGANVRRNGRLSATDREQQIVEEAIRFFAEVGFGGQTRELARRAGITQPLLYRYFSTKQDLVERVFKEVFLKRIDPSWTERLADRARPLEERLAEFYTAYSSATYTYEWIRIYMFSALMGNDINRRYIQIVEERILKPICAEVRHYCGLPGIDVIPISELELEHVWVMHGGLFYFAVRKYIYHSRVTDDFASVVKRAVAAMLEGVKAISRK